jgi:hypothetical protein
LFAGNTINPMAKTDALSPILGSKLEQMGVEMPSSKGGAMRASLQPCLVDDIS